MSTKDDMKNDFFNTFDLEGTLLSATNKGELSARSLISSFRNVNNVNNVSRVQTGRTIMLHDQGIAKTVCEEKLKIREEKLKKSAEDARMEALYRKHILQETKPQGGFRQDQAGTTSKHQADTAPKQGERD